MHGRPVSAEELELIRRLRCDEGLDFPQIVEAVAEQFGRRSAAAIKAITGSRKFRLPLAKRREVTAIRLANLKRNHLRTPT